MINQKIFGADPILGQGLMRAKRNYSFTVVPFVEIGNSLFYNFISIFSSKWNISKKKNSKIFGWKTENFQEIS